MSIYLTEAKLASLNYLSWFSNYAYTCIDYAWSGVHMGNFFVSEGAGTLCSIKKVS